MGVNRIGKDYSGRCLGGALGTFTTFSAFTIDVFFLIERGQLLPAAIHVTASMMLSLLGFIAGLTVLRHGLT